MRPIDEADARPARAPRDPHLENAAGGMKLIGGLFALVGGLVLAISLVDRAGRPQPLLIAGASGLLVAPGVLYVVAGFFLQARKYWAWVAAAVMTGALLLAVLAIGAVGLWDLLRSASAIRNGWPAVVAFVCWAGALVGILHSLSRCVSGVREAEQSSRAGFTVLPRISAHAAPPPAARAAQQDGTGGVREVIDGGASSWDGGGTVRLTEARPGQGSDGGHG